MTVPDPSAPFSLVLRGYDRMEVDVRLAELASMLQAARGDVATARSEATELQRDLAAHQTGGGRDEGRDAGPSFDAAGRMIAAVLERAHEEAERYRAEVDAAVADRRTVLEASLEDRRRRVDDELAALRAEAEGLEEAAATHLAAAEQVLAVAREEARATANEAARASEALLSGARAEVEALHETTRSQAASMAEQARADVEAIRAEADQRTAALDARRTDLLASLAAAGARARALLDRSETGADGDGVVVLDPVFDLAAVERDSLRRS